ncbi:LOW QUALITY PROTEIN: protocadherin alpha-8-like [Phycodurus eques]|uniref:protocadherin alpha-8-like n=1 Tax=Phycodurus eques TaxID=693459 RepID=UPI002ACE358F|nr:protocadherin alpha-8-like [Phycodurus eques]XP_061541489.1 LOW QUALITY PROTEIN: protocadherin alpha-8-like [Phycodurus eques]
MASPGQWRTVGGLFFTLLCLCGRTAAQISYSISEEVDKGTAVGNLAKDFNLSVQQLQAAGLHVNSAYKKRYFDVDLQSGILVVSERIDREELCPNVLRCSLNIEAALSRPRRLHQIEVVIRDVNDNAPVFSQETATIDLYENYFLGERHPLPLAHDADAGANSVKTYQLKPNEYFVLDAQSNGESASAELLLHKALDREKQPVVDLTLLAIDGGKPPKSGTIQILINVLDVNDNSPLFSKSLYKVRVVENADIGTQLLRLSASDLDDGVNGQLTYSFAERGRFNPDHVFALDENTGEISVKGDIDYEDTQAYEIGVQVRDKGVPPRLAHSKVLVEVIDVNDNAPEITVSSLMSPVKEDAEIGAAVAMVRITDKDGGQNGQTKCLIVGSVPFLLKLNYKNYYSLLVAGPLDRERTSRHLVTLAATDEGKPARSTTRVIDIQVSDVNDNPPHFAEREINIYVKENSPVGTTIYTLTTTDADSVENGKASYRLIDSSFKTTQTASLINIDSESGDIVTLQSFDYETLKTFEFKVQAADRGVPPLSGEASVNVFILDENDNSPGVLPPYSEHGSANGESVPFSAEAGYFVAKIRAVDADSGYNALLSYRLSEPKGGDDGLFRIGSGTGEIRTKRRMSDDDLKSHPLVVLVCDHGEASLSATVSIDVLVLESAADVRAPFRHVPGKEESFSRFHLYLLIAIAAVSLVFLLGLLAFAAFKCRGRTDGAPTIGARPDGSRSYSKATQQYDVCLGSDTLKSDLVLFPSPFPPGEAELISIHGGDTFGRTQTLPHTEKVGFTFIQLLIDIYSYTVY